ncbi:hypothetical protein [Pseudoalteromonas phenolica]|uniref:hypothetical protein n=1 Tax=Pseudoalteromonas phenolica TaxID=161398 RepID=UPI00110A87BD|nr:hypothetical protein [Pseudoalteromonas phenolica]TMO53147.1 hypothetical protein CWC21_20960 [Pseudoalteromonas phenolica]
MNKLVFKSALLLSTFMLSTVSQASDNEIRLIMCKDCTYDEAVQLARKEGPVEVCTDTPTLEVKTKERCHSTPRKVIVADVTGNEHLAFNVLHYNPEQRSELAVERMSLTSVDKEAIRRVKETANNLEKFSESLQQELDSNPAFAQPKQYRHHSAQSASNLARASDNCPAYIAEAFDSIYNGKKISAFASAVNEKAKRDFKNPSQFFMSKEMTSAPFSLELWGGAYGGTWKNVSRKFNNTAFSGTGPNNSDVPSSDTGFEVVYTLNWNKDNGFLDVKVNDSRTKVAGLYLKELRGKKVRNLDPCVSKQFRKYFTAKVTKGLN